MQRAHTKLTTIAVLSDFHFPEVDQSFWRATLSLLAEVQPDEIVLNGDFGEFSSGNGHTPDVFKAAYADDVSVVRSALRQLRKTCANAKLTYLEGNHENMTIRALANGAPAFVKGFWERFAGELDFEKLGIEWVPEGKQPLRRGNLRVLHGHQVPGKHLPKHHAAKMADLYGAPNLVVCFGHSHRPQTHVRASKEGDCTAYALGCGRTLDPAWTKGSPGGWRHELGIAYVRPDGAANLYPVRFEAGALAWAGKLYR
jgi:predicted phosphodiesterase